VIWSSYVFINSIKTQVLALNTMDTDQKIDLILKEIGALKTSYGAVVSFLEKNFTVAERIIKEKDIKKQFKQEEGKVLHDIKIALKSGDEK